MPESLQKMRSQIDKIDQELIKVLAKRFIVTKKVGQHKIDNQLSAQDKTRERAMFLQRKSWAKENGLSENLVKDIFSLIIKKVVKDNAKTD
ncbi:MAG: chorismate mutase [bacterium]|nr:chorismate mutase [bacterium]